MPLQQFIVRSEQPNGWREQQEILLHYLQQYLHSLRLCGQKNAVRIIQPKTLTTNLFVPPRRRLRKPTTRPSALLGIPDGIPIQLIRASARPPQETGKDALVIWLNIHDTTRRWLEGWVASQQGWRIDAGASPASSARNRFDGKTLLVWCGENQTPHAAAATPHGAQDATFIPLAFKTAANKLL